MEELLFGKAGGIYSHHGFEWLIYISIFRRGLLGFYRVSVSSFYTSWYVILFLLKIQCIKGVDYNSAKHYSRI
jgi:hypothetical protein